MGKKITVTYAHQNFVKTTVERLSEKQDGSKIIVVLKNNQILMRAVVKAAEEGLNITEFCEALSTPVVDEDGNTIPGYEFNENTLKTNVSNLRVALAAIGKTLPDLARRPRSSGGGRAATPVATIGELGSFFDDLCPSEEGDDPTSEGTDEDYGDSPSNEEVEAMLAPSNEEVKD